jgi:hypothetical protein
MNVPFNELWLPIVLAAITVFMVSSLIWTVVQYHNSDWHGLDDEDAARTVFKNQPPGQYAVPYAADNRARASETWQQKYREGPVAMITVMQNGNVNMAGQLIQWFVYCLVISVFVAYVAGSTLSIGSDYLKVYQVTSTVAFLAYGGMTGIRKIWFGQPTGSALKDLVDALIYGLLTAGFFGWLWP